LIDKYVKFVIASPEGVAISFYKQEIALSSRKLSGLLAMTRHLIPVTTSYLKIAFHLRSATRCHSRGGGNPCFSGHSVDPRLRGGDGLNPKFPF